MALAEIDHLRLGSRPKLQRLTHPRRKRRFAHLPAARTGFALGLVFGRYYAYRRQVKDLATFAPFHWHVSQTTLVGLALLHPMHLDFIRVNPHRQRMPFVPRLSAAWLTTCLA